MPQKTKKTLPPSPRPFVKGGKGPLHPPSFPSYLLLFLPNLPSPPPMAAALPSMDRLDAARALLGVVGPACLNNAAQGTSGQEFAGGGGGPTSGSASASLSKTRASSFPMSASVIVIKIAVVVAVAVVVKVSWFAKLCRDDRRSFPFVSVQTTTWE